ncbi:MAG: endopygalactorunase [Bacteroidales bacterium]|nr:endopygalactorunase [Bacteroidales bacterium]
MTAIRTFILLIVSFLINAVDAEASTKEILIPGRDAPNIIRITADSVIFVTGITRSFTVDTPEDQGPVSTGLEVSKLSDQLKMRDGSPLIFSVYDSNNQLKRDGEIESGDMLEITVGKGKKRYKTGVRRKAMAGKLILHQENIRVNTTTDLVLDFIAGQRTPKATVRIMIPEGIPVTPENTTVNVIGRGEVQLSGLAHQSIGKTGTNYSYKKTGEVTVEKYGKGQVITFSNIDLRPLNGIDLRIKIKNVRLRRTGQYSFKAYYSTTEPEALSSAGTEQETAILTAGKTVADFRRNVIKMPTYQDDQLYTQATFLWTPVSDASEITLLQSTDGGKQWIPVNTRIAPGSGEITIDRLDPDKLYLFKLDIKSGNSKGRSNTAYFYSGKWDVRKFGVRGDGETDDTDSINAAIAYMNRIGGGTLLFGGGIYSMRTIHLKSNVWIYVDRDAVLQALSGSDEPEATWFSDKAYRSGLSPTDPKPYADPENYLTKQDVGHTFFRNTMFFAEREDNIKIIGNGRITGNGNLATSDRVMNNAPGKRADKMFTFKLCTNIEIAGFHSTKDLWYDEEKDEPYYMEQDGLKNFDVSNMLHIDRGGHFVLLATGTDSIHVHNTYFAKHHTGNARDIYDFMACNHVTVTNIYSKVSSDDIVKLGSDCSLGFTRPVKNYWVRNIIGDTNCNLFQIGSETADDIQDVYVDNIYVLGSNKAGFSISANDGAHIKNIYLNGGQTGPIHSRSVMKRTRAPFFISISNRGRVIGADVAMFTFEENGNIRKELLCTNSNIGKVENIFINSIDISEVYAGSSFRGGRWKAYDGSQNEATPIIAGYSLPKPEKTEGGLNFTLPDGRHTGYITHIRFYDVNLLVKGGHPVEDTQAYPPEIGVGRYNVGDLKIQPAYGFWVRHAKGFELVNCSIAYESPDLRYPVVLEDVTGAKIKSLTIPSDNKTLPLVKEINSSQVVVEIEN